MSKWSKAWSIYKARAAYLAEVNDPALRLPPLPPRPPKRDKRRPTKPR